MNQKFFVLIIILSCVAYIVIYLNAHRTPYSASYLLLYASLTQGILLSMFILDKLGYPRLSSLGFIFIGLLFVLRPEEMAYMFAAARGYSYTQETMENSLIFLRMFGVLFILFTLFREFFPGRGNQ